MEGLYMSFKVWPPKTLNDVIIENSEEEIDKEILPLVKAINLLGVPTYSSCAGHVNGAGLPYPWVGILKRQYEFSDYSRSIEKLDAEGEAYIQSRLKGSLERFYYSLNIFNKINNENIWLLDEPVYSHLRPRWPCKDAASLDTERKKVAILANILFDEFTEEYRFYTQIK
jgi:tRNA(Phe) wybutosine-synthesizing methylase Tyw3